jgi:DNA-binding response OmpR family regulator
MRFRVLIVDQVAASRAAIERLLSDAGHFVTSVSGFSEAKQRLVLTTPDILVTTLKLGAYNGIQLVLRGRANGGTMPAIVIHDVHDPVLEREATNAGAVYLTLPLDNPSFEALVERLLTSAPPNTTSTVPRKWPRKQAGVAVAVSGDEARVVDVSYGGLRFEMSNAPDEALWRVGNVDIPNVGPVPIHPVWARGSDHGPGRWWCGAEVDAADESTADAWRRFVDSLS